MVEYNDRVIYIKQIEVTIGDGHKAYAFLGYDLDQADHEIHKCLKKSKEMSTMQIQKKLESMGYFVLISSLPFPIEEVLPA